MMHSLSPNAMNSTGASSSSEGYERPVAPKGASSRLGRAIEACLGLAILIPPFIFGGREAYGQLTLAVLVLTTFGLWIVRRIGQGPSYIPLRRPEILLVLAAIGLCLASWIPL